LPRPLEAGRGTTREERVVEGANQAHDVGTVRVRDVIPALLEADTSVTGFIFIVIPESA
jgi:hypothetical protein